MMSYNGIDNTLHKLMEINWEIKKKKEEISNANKYNLRNHISELEINVQSLIDEKTNLEFEFRELVLTLRS